MDYVIRSNREAISPAGNAPEYREGSRKMIMLYRELKKGACIVNGNLCTRRWFYLLLSGGIKRNTASIARWMLLPVVILLLFASCSNKPAEFEISEVSPHIFPDYTYVTIPPNIAPLNFKVQDTCEAIYVEFQGREGSLEISAPEKTDIPIGKWHELLERNAGDSLVVTLYLKRQNKWVRLKPFSIYVSDTPMDSHLVYRKIAPGYIAYGEMGIYQRNLGNFDEHAIVSTRLLPNTCMNCHSFSRNDPSTMLFHIRAANGGTMIIRDGQIDKINTKTEETISNGVYPYWHPSGEYVAFSVNRIYQMFHSIPTKRIEVFDTESDLVVLDVESNTLATDSLISSKASFETFPCFAPDGRSLIFTSAEARTMPDEYDQVKYSLCSIPFDPETGTFGHEVDTLIDADEFGLSISFPRVSPDGKFLMFTASAYGNFTIWHQDADLYLLDLETGQYEKMSVNTDRTESYHSWSSDSRWFVFSSRRMDGLYTHPHIAYVDAEGNETKPFMLPQKDPDYYVRFMKSFNVPELITGPVDLDVRELERINRNSGGKVQKYELYVPQDSITR